MDDYEIDEEDEDDDFIDDGASEDIEGMDEEEEDDSFADDKED